MRKLILIVAGLLAVVSFAANAGKLYKWVDSRGNVSYQDAPPPPGKGRVEEKNLGARGAANAAGEGAAARAPVVLYVAPKCAVCDIARNYLSKRKIPFAEKNIGTDLKAQEELKAKVGAAVLPVPAIAIGPKLMTEYSQSWLESELAAAGYDKAGADARPTEDQTTEIQPEGAQQAEQQQ